jgi:hypothetical protein
VVSCCAVAEVLDIGLKILRVIRKLDTEFMGESANGARYIAVVLECGSEIDNVTTVGRAEIVPGIILHPEGGWIFSARAKR